MAGNFYHLQVLVSWDICVLKSPCKVQILMQSVLRWVNLWVLAGMRRKFERDCFDALLSHYVSASQQHSCIPCRSTHAAKWSRHCGENMSQNLSGQLLFPITSSDTLIVRACPKAVKKHQSARPDVGDRKHRRGSASHSPRPAPSSGQVPHCSTR